MTELIVVGVVLTVVGLTAAYILNKAEERSYQKRRKGE